MIRLRGRLVAVCIAACSTVLPACADPPANQVRLLFGGDVMPARGVEAEAVRRGATPFRNLVIPGAFDFFMANLEGAVGRPSDCLPAPRDPCLAISDRGIGLLRDAPVRAYSLANNHAGDTGPAGRERTVAALSALGIVAVPSDEHPTFIRTGGLTIGLVALSIVPPKDRAPDAVPSAGVARRIRLARAFSDLTVAFLHWGAELRDWPQPSQEAQAGWLVRQGVDLIVGAHPHVTIPPDCIDGVPVFWSLGNLVFDQPDPETRKGMIADCRVSGGVLSCGELTTAAALGSSFPHIAGASGVPCWRRATGVCRTAWRLAVGSCARTPRSMAA